MVDELLSTYYPRNSPKIGKSSSGGVVQNTLLLFQSFKSLIYFMHQSCSTLLTIGETIPPTKNNLISTKQVF